MKVVHLALTPLAGAPIRIVSALNAHTGVQARFVDLNPFAYGGRVFDEDIHFAAQPDLARTVIEAADVVHLHHWFDLRNNPFGVDLSHKPVLRHLHSHPEWVARHGGGSADQVVNDPLPQVVVAQFQERFYPHAKPVPNLVRQTDIDAATRGAAPGSDGRVGVVFQPTTDVSAFEARWDTKGRPETLALLQGVTAALGLRIDAETDLPYRTALARKAGADLVIDELVTGSYHLSSLEGLALGKPTLAWLDARTVAVLAALTGTADLPWINVHLMQAEAALRDLACDAALRVELGANARHWMRQHWDEARLVRHYVDAYDDVLSGLRPQRGTRASGYVAINLPDIEWQHRTEALAAAIADAEAGAPPATPAADQLAPRALVRLAADTVQLTVGGTTFEAADHWFWQEFVDGWEADTERVYQAFARPDRDIVDVGAWVGPTALFAAAYGARRVVAIEPNPLSTMRLQDLRRRNLLLADKLVVIAEGVGAEAGVIEFGAADGRVSDSSACSIRGRGMQVPVRPLPALLDSIDGLNPSLIKIDIEGAEFVIADQIAALSAYADCAVFLSLHPPFRPDGVSSDALLAAIAGFDIIDCNAQPIAHDEIVRRVFSSEERPAWGTAFGNFFEILLLPRVAAAQDGAPAADEPAEAFA